MQIFTKTLTGKTITSDISASGSVLAMKKKIQEKDGIPVIGIMGADELEDYLELKDTRVNAQIRQSNRDIKAGKVRPATELLRELAVSAAKPSRMRK